MNSPNIVRIKEGSGNFWQIMQIIANRPSGFKVLAGDDATALPLICLGASGRERRGQVGRQRHDRYSRISGARQSARRGREARVLGEYGVIGVMVGGHQWDDIAGWGYIKTSPAQMVTKYEAMIAKLKKLEAEGLSGSIYTQPFDVETEQNGLLTYDRKVVKAAVRELRRINSALLPQQEKFAAAGSDLAALPTPQDTYHALLERYRRDKNDIGLLRSLAVMARSVGDNPVANQAMGDYMSRVAANGWYTKNDIQFLRNLTQSSTDQGFSLFYRDGQRIGRVMEIPDYARYVVDGIIAKEEIAARLWESDRPRTSRRDWAQIESAMAQKYDRATAERLVRNARLEFYRKIEDWPEYARTRDEDIQKHPPTAKEDWAAIPGF